MRGVAELVAAVQGQDMRPVALGGVALLVLVVARALLGRRGPRAAVGEVWFAQVPFREGTGSKDRPVLVLAVHGRSVSVARFTSQDRGARADHRRVPDGLGLRKASWVDLQPLTLSRRALRRRVASPGPAAVDWYARVAGWEPTRR